MCNVASAPQSAVDATADPSVPLPCPKPRAGAAAPSITPPFQRLPRRHQRRHQDSERVPHPCDPRRGRPQPLPGAWARRVHRGQRVGRGGQARRSAGGRAAGAAAREDQPHEVGGRPPVGFLLVFEPPARTVELVLATLRASVSLGVGEADDGERCGCGGTAAASPTDSVGPPSRDRMKSRCPAQGARRGMRNAAATAPVLNGKQPQAGVGARSYWLRRLRCRWPADDAAAQGRYGR